MQPSTVEGTKAGAKPIPVSEVQLDRSDPTAALHLTGDRTTNSPSEGAKHCSRLRVLRYLDIGGEWVTLSGHMESDPMGLA